MLQKSSQFEEKFLLAHLDEHHWVNQVAPKIVVVGIEEPVGHILY